MLYKSRFYTIKHELSPVSIHMFQLNLISNADIIHVEGADSHHFISINLGKWCLTQNPLTHEKCCSHMLHHEWSHEITIWLFNKNHGESLINGGFNGKIIYKWAIYTMAMLVITRGYNQNHQSGARPGHQNHRLKWADRGGSKPKARTWRRLARRPSGSVFPLCQQRWIVVNNGFTG